MDTTQRQRKELTPEQREKKRAVDKARKQELRDLKKQTEGRLKPVEPLPPTKVVGEGRTARGVKRLEGVLKTHGVMDAEIAKAVATPAPKPDVKAVATPAPLAVDDDEPILKRAPKVAKPVSAKGKRLLTPKPAPAPRNKVAAGITLTLSKTYQREGKVAGGTEVNNGKARQLAVCFPNKMFDKLAKLAKKNGISLSEQVRQAVVTSFDA